MPCHDGLTLVAVGIVSLCVCFLSNERLSSEGRHQPGLRMSAAATSAAEVLPADSVSASVVVFCSHCIMMIDQYLRFNCVVEDEQSTAGCAALTVVLLNVK